MCTSVPTTWNIETFKKANPVWCPDFQLCADHNNFRRSLIPLTKQANNVCIKKKTSSKTVV